MHRAPLKARIFAGIAAMLLLCLSAGSAWAVADDYQVRNVMPAGSAIAGVDVGGMTRADASALIEEELVAPLSEPITVRYGDQTFILPAENLVKIDLDTMLAGAFEPKATASLPRRVMVRLTDEQIGDDVPLALSLDEDALDAWLTEVAGQVNRPAVDATASVETTGVVFIAAESGVVLDEQAARAELSLALRTGSKEIDLPVDVTEPSMTDADLGKLMFVSLAERKVYLYNNGELEKSYSIAIGAPGHSTPRGDWEITAKRYMPTWGNPGSAWAENMPATIAPGPNNPLGTRAINISASGIRFHGTTDDASIGRAASHGCMRMHMWDVEDLYDRVEVGIPVYIR
ncbi:MAG: L,D-transpeptidase/peptidoglycan binding protein [Coriobacteriia bacterium]|nr:L,D-transpeptidase/peptidoglycan binding protein [Coriobacteriia bacterium]MBN2822009.1 L,D-transpeptidase/peptidoglycan binding protein [Coriobacteriia bacterium]